MIELTTPKALQVFMKTHMHGSDEVLHECMTNTYYKFVDNEWKEFQKVDKLTEVTVNYREMLINTIKDKGPMNFDDIEEQFIDWAASLNTDYFLLYGREIGYFTIIKVEDVPFPVEERMKLVLQECLSNVGTLIYYECDFDKDNQCIFWVRLPDGTVTELYLFNAKPFMAFVGGI